MIDLKPDYKKWWNKKDLNENELSWLVFDVEPEIMERFNYLQGSKANRTPEENKFIDDVGNEIAKTIYNLPHNIIDMRAKVLLKKYWQSGKSDFVKNIYENGVTDTLNVTPYYYLDAHPDFWAFLESIKERPTHLDIQRDIEQLKLNVSEWQNAEIKDENTAIAILLGYEPKWFIKRFVEAEEKHSADWSIEEKTLDRTFYRADDSILNKFLKLKRFSLWQNDFNQFANAIYNQGYIFNDDVQELIRLKNINLKYEQNSWVYKLYEEWINKKVWSFHEALLLFNGYNPENQFEGIIDFKHGLKLLIPFEAPKTFKTNIASQYKELYELMLRHTAINDLTRIEIKGKEAEHYFNYIEITKWLIEQTGFEPVPILSEMLGLQDSESLKADKNEPETDKLAHRLATKEEISKAFEELQASYKTTGKRLRRDEEEKEMRKRLYPSTLNKEYYRKTLRKKLGLKKGRHLKK